MNTAPTWPLPLRSRDPRDMLLVAQYIREFEMAVLQLRRDELISGSVHVCVGQEVVPVSVLASLDGRDRVLATYRGHGWALASGVPPLALMAEILGRRDGTNAGRGGSAYLTAPEWGFIGENSIVGAGAPIANGVAMGLVAQGAGGVAVVSVGDGATNQGSVHEALVFALARRLPVLFVCENNSWSEMTPIEATVPHVRLCDRAAAYGIPAVGVDGSDPVNLEQTIAGVMDGIRSGGGPAFVEVQVPRILGHYNGDIEHYRSKEDRAQHAARDPISALVQTLTASGALGDNEWTDVQSDVKAAVDHVVRLALTSPWPDPATAREHVIAPSVGSPPLPTDGSEEAMTFGLAANKALHIEMQTRPETVCFGEDIAIPGGTFGVTRNLRKVHGERVFDTPIAEASILGAALGASLEGLLPIVEIMWSDFLLVAFDQVVNQMANVRYLSQGRVSAPVVIRMQQGMTPGSCAQHSQSLEALLTHIPGLKVGLPSCAQDAFAMLRAAVADPDPVIIIESRALYQDVGSVRVTGPVEAAAGARLRRHGSDVAIVSWGRMVETSLSAAEMLANDGVAASVLDLRWLSPLDEASIVDVLRAAGGKVVIAHEANTTGGFGAEIAARLASNHLSELDGPIVRVGLPDVRVPASPALQSVLLPSAETIADAARRLVAS